MGQHTVKILAALIDNSSQTDDLRSGAHNNQQLQFSVVLKRNIRIIQLHFHGDSPFTEDIDDFQ